MKKRTLGIVSAALALALAVPVAFNFADNQAKADVESAINVAQDNEVIEKTLTATPDGPNVYYNTLPTIKSGPYNYSEMKDKTVIIYYKSNNVKSGYNKMVMNVEEYEADGVTPKTVSYSTQVPAVQRSHTPYTIYALKEDHVNYLGNFPKFLSKEVCKTVPIDEGLLENSFLDLGETPNPKKSIVTLASDPLNFELFIDGVIYSEITYSINGEEEKTIYGFINLRRDKEDHTIGYNTISAEVYANVGDVIEYKIKLPLQDGDTYQYFKATVVE